MWPDIIDSWLTIPPICIALFLELSADMPQGGELVRTISLQKILVHVQCHCFVVRVHWL